MGITPQQRHALYKANQQRKAELGKAGVTASSPIKKGPVSRLDQADSNPVCVVKRTTFIPNPTIKDRWES